MSQRTVSNQTRGTKYHGYHQDSLLDIFLALGILFATAAFSAGMFWLIAILPVVFSLLWISSRQSITSPSLARSSSFATRSGNKQPVFTLLTILGVVSFVLGAVVFWMFTTDNTPAGLREWFQQNLVLGAWVFGGLLLGLIALLAHLPRYYFYALLVLALGIGGPLLGFQTVLYIVGIAFVMLMVGLLNLFYAFWTRQR